MTHTPSGPLRLVLRALCVPVTACSLSLPAQTPAPSPPTQPDAPPTQPEAQPPAGKVLFSRGIPAPADTPDAAETAEPASAAISTSVPSRPQGPPDTLPAIPVTQAERSALRIVAYDLDLHLIPADSALEMHATVTLRNIAAAPIARIPLQISSSLRWQTISGQTASGLRPVSFTQSPVATDTDHTGYAQEAVVTLAEPLAPGSTVALSVFYAGEIRQTAARLELLGTPSDRADQTDWDEIVATNDDAATALRGFGNVLWLPVAAPTALFGDGNQLFDLVNRERAAAASATVRLHLAVDYVGDPPVGAIFDGELHPLTAMPDEQDELITQTHGLAISEFPSRPVGFRLPSLFLTAQQPTVSESQALAVITPNAELASPYREAAAQVQPLLSDWFGVNPIQPLTLLDHAGEPFQDDALLVMKLSAGGRVADLARRLAGPLTHAWFRSSHPWIGEGLADFMGLLWTERSKGREAAVAAYQEQTGPLALAEPDLSAAAAQAGEPLTKAISPIYFRTKAAAVWWQLREILGEDTLRQGLIAYRHSESIGTAFDSDPKAMQATLERVSGKDLAWFFDDWVYRDRGLPDLEIVEVNPHPLPEHLGKSDGYLVAVAVRNLGDAAAEVPVTVRSGGLSATERLRIAARSLATTRIVFNGTPETVQVNDGSTPELRSSMHSRQIEIHLQ